MSVSVSNLEVVLSSSGVPVVSGIEFELQPGEVLGIVGESGSGKTTLALALLGYFRRGTRVSPGSRIVIDGQSVLDLPGNGRGSLVAYVPQDPSASLNPALTIGTQLLDGLVHGPVPIGREEALNRIRSIMEDVSLPATPAILDAYPSQLSGGQQQRVVIAMAIACHPRLIILDEPTTGLDVSTQMEVLRLVSRVCKTHKVAAIYVSHDLAVISHVADRVLVMYSGAIVEHGGREAVFSRPVHPYTRALLNALPTLAERRALAAIHGSAPALDARGAGCTFRDRCAHAAKACEEAPALHTYSSDGNHLVRCHFPRQRDDTPSTADAFHMVGGARAAQPVLSIGNLAAWYGDKQVLHGISLDLHRGECVAIVGESGSGKSTFGRSLIGLHRQYSGTVLLHAEDGTTARPADAEYRRRVQYIFQNPYASLHPRRTIGASIGLVVNHFFGGKVSNPARVVEDALARVGLPKHFIQRYPNELSGGEKQRAAIARALVCQPEVLICDEVTSALDVSVQAVIIELLRSLMQDGLGMMFVTHNLAVVRSIADRIAVLYQGRIVELGESERVLMHPKAEYTQHLLSHALELETA